MSSVARMKKKLIIDLCEQMRTFLDKWKERTEFKKERWIGRRASRNFSRWGWLPWYSAEIAERDARLAWKSNLNTGGYYEYLNDMDLHKVAMKRLKAIQLLTEFTVDDEIFVSSLDLCFLNEGVVA